MALPMSTAEAVGYTAYGCGLVAEVAVPTPEYATSYAVWLALAGLLTTVVNAVVTDRKGKRETEERLAKAKVEAEVAVAEAKAEADHKLADAQMRIAVLEARLEEDEAGSAATSVRRHAQLGALADMIDGLRYHALETTDRLNAITPMVAGQAGPALPPIASPLDDAAWAARRDGVKNPSRPGESPK